MKNILQQYKVTQHRGLDTLGKLWYLDKDTIEGAGGYIGGGSSN